MLRNMIVIKCKRFNEHGGENDMRMVVWMTLVGYKDQPFVNSLPRTTHVAALYCLRLGLGVELLVLLPREGGCQRLA